MFYAWSIIIHARLTHNTYFNTTNNHHCIVALKFIKP